jgi:hypothetical protein
MMRTVKRKACFFAWVEAIPNRQGRFKTIQERFRFMGASLVAAAIQHPFAVGWGR